MTPAAATRQAPAPGNAERIRSHPQSDGQWLALLDRLRSERVGRQLVLVESASGLVLLLIAQLLSQDTDGRPAGWLAAICGLAGVWLVPGAWLAYVIGVGSDPLAVLTVRIGTALAWYAVVPVIASVAAEGARATPGLVLDVTTIATVAGCLGVFLGLLAWPVRRYARAAFAAATAAAVAQVVIELATRYWTQNVNYEHVHRLDWLIVLGCAALAVGGQLGHRPRKVAPERRTTRTVVAGVLAIVIGAGFTGLFAWVWPVTQHLPTEIAIEQVTTPPGADFAVGLTGLGAHGDQAVSGAVLEALDGHGHPVSIDARRIPSDDPRADIVVATVEPAGVPELCGETTAPTPPVLLVRDRVSTTFVQVQMPKDWCKP